MPYSLFSNDPAYTNLKKQAHRINYRNQPWLYIIYYFLYSNYGS